jgi:hypothetical protein
MIRLNSCSTLSRLIRLLIISSFNSSETTKELDAHSGPRYKSRVMISSNARFCEIRLELKTMAGLVKITSILIYDKFGCSLYLYITVLLYYKDQHSFE